MQNMHSVARSHTSAGAGPWGLPDRRTARVTEARAPALRQSCRGREALPRSTKPCRGRRSLAEVDEALPRSGSLAEVGKPCRGREALPRSTERLKVSCRRQRSGHGTLDAARTAACEPAFEECQPTRTPAPTKVEASPSVRGGNGPKRATPPPPARTCAGAGAP
jgi:hypothetical protein